MTLFSSFAFSFWQLVDILDVLNWLKNLSKNSTSCYQETMVSYEYVKILACSSISWKSFTEGITNLPCSLIKFNFEKYYIILVLLVLLVIHFTVHMALFLWWQKLWSQLQVFGKSMSRTVWKLLMKYNSIKNYFLEAAGNFRNSIMALDVYGKCRKFLKVPGNLGKIPEKS